MDLYKLWYNDHTKEYYQTDDVGDVCFDCEVELDHVIYLYLDFKYKKKKDDRSRMFLYCPNCIKNAKQIGQESQEIVVVVMSRLPKDSRPIILKSTGTKTRRNLSSFDVAGIEAAYNYEGETIDDTKLAGRSDTVQQLKYVAVPMKQLGEDSTVEMLEDTKNIIDEKDRELSDDDADDFFNNLKEE